MRNLILLSMFTLMLGIFLAGCHRYHHSYHHNHHKHHGHHHVYNR